MANLEDILNNPNLNSTSNDKIKVDPAKADTIEIPVGLLENLQKEIAELKKGQDEIKQNQKIGVNSEEELEENLGESNVRLGEYKGHIVVAYNDKRGTWLKYDAERREDRLMQEIIYLGDDGKEVTEEVDYLKFMEDMKEVNVEVLRKESQKVETKKGLIRVREVVDYKTVETRNKVMQKVMSTIDWVVVKMPDGSERKININYVNLK